MNAEATGKKARTLGTSPIALISRAAVLTLRSLPSIAEDGWSSIAYLLGAVLFFIPLALIAAELAMGWPRAGGLYAWVKEAFGDRQPLGSSTNGVIPGMAGLQSDSAALPRPDVGGSIQLPTAMSVRGLKRFRPPAGDRLFPFESRA